MSKAKRTHAVTHAPKADPAAALIASTRHTGHAPDPSPEALEALRKVFAHNDALPVSGPCGRVSAHAAVTMLRESFGWGHGESALDALCRRLGRRSWGKP